MDPNNVPPWLRQNRPQQAQAPQVSGSPPAQALQPAWGGGQAASASTSFTNPPVPPGHYPSMPRPPPLPPQYPPQGVPGSSPSAGAQGWGQQQQQQQPVYPQQMAQQYPPWPLGPPGYPPNAQFGPPGPYPQQQQGYPQQRMLGPLPPVPLPPAGVVRKKILPSQKKKRILYVLSAALVFMALLALSTFVYFWLNFR